MELIQEELLESSYIEMIHTCLQKYLMTYCNEAKNLTLLLKQLQEKDQLICSRKNIHGHLTASGLYYDDDAKKVLLVHHKALDLWIQPGGHLELNELPLDGALREFQEETNIPGAAPHPYHRVHELPLDLDTHFIPANPRKGESDHYHHDFLYLLVNSDRPTELYLDEDELIDHKWISLPDLANGDYESKLKRAALKAMELVL